MNWLQSWLNIVKFSEKMWKEMKFRFRFWLFLGMYLHFFCLRLYMVYKYTVNKAGMNYFFLAINQNIRQMLSFVSKGVSIFFFYKKFLASMDRSTKNNLSISVTFGSSHFILPKKLQRIVLLSAELDILIFFETFCQKLN